MSRGAAASPAGGQLSQFFPLGGGLNLVTPAIALPPGNVIASSNYEPGPRGYGRVDGYERFDGQPKPSAATYYTIAYGSGTAKISKGDTVTGATSGATGTALVDQIVASGSYA